MVKCYNLTSEQEAIAKRLVEENKRKLEGYHLEEVETDMALVWQEESDDKDYKDFITYALENGTLYTLNDDLQTFGEVAVM